MKKSLIAMVIAGGMFSAAASAANITAGVSSATQDLTVGSYSASTTGTGVYLDWNKDTLFSLKKVGYGFYWNSATDTGNVLAAYIKPHYKTNKFDLFAKVGVSISGATTSVGSRSTASTSMTFGGGATYNINEKYGVTGEYLKLYSDENWDMSAMSVGVTLKY